MADSDTASDGATGLQPEDGRSTNTQRSLNRPAADADGSIRPPAAQPPGSAADSIQVGNISHATGVAVGAGASVTIHAAELAFDVSGLPNPYLGLRPFTYDERARFAGRDDTIRLASEKLTTPGAVCTLLFVTGASGSGKSSFAQAGLVPALEAYYARRTVHLRSAVIRPSRFPLARLHDALAQLGLSVPPTVAAFSAAGVSPFLAQHTPVSSVNLVVIDQFEELFTQAEPAQRDGFFASLETLAPFEHIRTHVIATLRSDYLPELFEHSALYEIAKQGVDLRAMGEHELRVAVVRPLQQFQTDGRVPAEKRWEVAVVERLAHDAAGDAAYLPLLQVTLEELWNGGSLRLSAYERHDGNRLDVALRERAEAVYAYGPDAGQGRTERPDAERQALLALLVDLVEVTLDDDTRRDVRRRRTFDELAHGDTTRARLIDELSVARLLSRGVERRGDDAAETDVVDIIHETLIHNWPRLGEAIRAQRQVLQRRVRFQQALDEWREHERSDEYLLPIRIT